MTGAWLIISLQGIKIWFGLADEISVICPAGGIIIKRKFNPYIPADALYYIQRKKVTNHIV